MRSERAALADGRIRAGSVTKAVNASVVLQFAAENRLSLDSTAQGLLPGLLTDDFTQPVTVRNLLNHTSAIQAGAGLDGPWEEQYAHRFDRLPVAEVVRTAVAKGPAFDPGEQQQYLSINYTLLALIVEKVTGHPSRRSPPGGCCGPSECAPVTSPATRWAAGAPTTAATNWWTASAWTSPGGG
nr:serine hydrolase domain-containing protein [Streptomyces albidoflavus]